MTIASPRLLDGLIDASIEAGRIILDVYARPIDVVFKADASPVTEADGLAEAVLLADDAAAQQVAAAAFGDALFALAGGQADSGARWGLVWGAGLQQGAADARDFFAAARHLRPPERRSFNGNKALLMLDRWAAMIAESGGERRWRREGLLLLRIGLIGR